uniref:Uncharacterized protein n=1 Tax=Knipowitschia caucasica TaxID=637954 RepID=A0AAV2LXI8_KNICA
MEMQELVMYSWLFFDRSADYGGEREEQPGEDTDHMARCEGLSQGISAALDLVLVQPPALQCARLVSSDQPFIFPLHSDYHSHAAARHHLDSSADLIPSL